MGFLVDSQGFDDAELDPEARKLTLTFPLKAGGERRFVVAACWRRGIRVATP